MRACCYVLSKPRSRVDETNARGALIMFPVPKDGSGFFINLPVRDFDIVITAGHNLVDAPKSYCTNIRVFRADEDPNNPARSVVTEIPIDPSRDPSTGASMVEVHPQYFKKPNELSAIYDYAMIRLPRKPGASKTSGFGFGYSLLLGIAPPLGSEDKDELQGRQLHVSGFRPEDKPDSRPARSSGSCTVADKYDLQYDAKTKPGISGGPVWLGFRGLETVVAVQYVSLVLLNASCFPISIPTRASTTQHNLFVILILFGFCHGGMKRLSNVRFGLLIFCYFLTPVFQQLRR